MITRLVLDTQVWLDWLHFRDPRCADLEAAFRRGAIEITIDPACRAEWDRVLAYSRLSLDAPAREQLANALDARVVPLATRTQDSMTSLPQLPRCRDPDDQKFVELAVRAGANVLLSRDKALLDLHRRLHRDFGIHVAPPQHFAQLPGTAAR